MTARLNTVSKIRPERREATIEEYVDERRMP